MEKVLLSIIAASGLFALSSHVGRRYHFVYELKNMTEALSYCRETYTDLATIDSMEDVKMLNNMADLSKMVYSGYSYRAWIGLYNDLDSWRWSLSDRSFYNHGETEFRRWSPTEPNNKKGREHCTEMFNNGLWNDVPCERLSRAVCSDVRGPNVTFVVTNKSMTWTEAQSHCRAHYTDLTSVRNMAENEKIMKVLPKEHVVWIGLFRDSWKWSDGSNSTFRYWKQESGEPNNNYWKEACVAADFNTSGEWEDWNCDWKRAFICYSEVSPTKQVMKVRLLKKSSSLNLNDPVVMEDILKQLKQRLKEQGVNEDIKLSWKRQSDGKIFHKDKKKTKKKNAMKKKDEL